MKRPGIFPVLLLLAFASATPAQEDETRKLRDELIKARLENLTLKLRLARLSPGTEDELMILEQALDAELPEVVGAAFRELSSLPEDRRKTAVPAVLRRFPAGRDAFRIEAVAFLGRVPSPDAESIVLRSAADPSPAVRKAVAGALKNASHGPAAETLLALFRDSDPGVRIAALDALGVAKREPAVGPLTAALAAESDPLILERTVDALGAIGSPAATDALVTLLSKTPRETIRWSCINSLGKIGDGRAGPRLMAFIDAPQPLDVRQVAIESLGKLKEISALPRLSEILRKAPEEKLRRAAAAAFGLMAGAGAIDETLLPAYLAESSEAPRKAIWASLLALAGDGFIANEKLALAFLAASRSADADEICTRLHGSRPEGDLKARRLGLEEAVARTFTEAGDFKAALPHCKQVVALAPDRADAARRLAACHRELKDLDSCLKTLGELKDPEPLIEEASAQLQSAPSEERRKSLELTLRAAALRLIEPLGGKDEAARKTAIEAARRLGRKIIPSLAAELEEGSKSAAALLEAGGAITGIPNDPAATNGYKAKAASWRAWMEKK